MTAFHRFFRAIAAPIQAAALALILVAAPGAMAQTPETDTEAPAPGAATPLPDIDAERALSPRVLGDADAPVTIYDYSALTCGHCADFHLNTLPDLKEEFIETGKVKLVFRDMPFNEAGVLAHALARCAPKPRYWALLDLLFAQQRQWVQSETRASLKQLASLAGMDADTVEACWANRQIEDGVLQTALGGRQKYNVRSTPTFVFNDGEDRIVGAQDIEAFRDVIGRFAP